MTTKRTPPKGGAPKGGARFPRYGLKVCVDWAKKLVAKTHNGPQAAEIIYASVVGSKGPTGEIKASALRQFNLMDGSKEAYVATALAKSIAVAPDDEIRPLLAQAALTPPIFKALFDTFHGDEVTVAKLKQRASELNVHLDNLDNVVSLYSSSLNLAGLVSADGEKVSHQSMSSVVPTASEIISGNGSDYENESENDGGEEVSSDPVETPRAGTPKAIFHVNVSLDASLDSDKLEKQLALLKRYGAI